MLLKLITMTMVLGSAAMVSCNSQNSSPSSASGSTKDSSITSKASIVEKPVSYEVNGKTYDGYVTFDSSEKGKRPAILVVPEWWGLTDYPRSRARQLAELGYIAMAVDMYGDGKTAEDPKTAQELATPYYKDPTLSKTVLDVAMNVLRKYPQTDTSKMAAIGYCYGGFVVLNAAKLGIDLKGIVSFHGGLGGVPVDKKLIKAKILICHGADDQFTNPEVPAFKKSMDSAGVDYTFISYPGATHAFSNPAATAKGIKYHMPIAYNAAADSASWSDMKAFFKKIF
jgi:dienelactone hydrolase